MELTGLRDEINRMGIFRCPPGFRLQGIPAGTAYSWQFYLRNVMTNPECMRVIAREMGARIEPQYQLAGMESAGPPIVTAIFMNQSKHAGYFFLRKEQKKYGLLNWIEGVPDRSREVVLVDDISNSKNTLMMAHRICSFSGLQVSHAVTIVNKKDTDTDVKSGLTVESLFTLDDFDLTWESYYHRLDARSERIARATVLQQFRNVLWYEYEPGKLIPCNQIKGFDKYIQHLYGDEDENKANFRVVSQPNGTQ